MVLSFMANTTKGEVLLLLPGFRIFGQERAFIVLARLLRENGFNCTFLIHGKWGEEQIGAFLRSEGFEVATLPLNTIWSARLFLRNPLEVFFNIWGVIQSSARLVKLCRQRDYQAIIAGNISFAAYIGPALPFLGIPFIFRHGDAPLTGNLFHRLLSKYVLSLASRHVVNCKFIEQKLTAFLPNVRAQLIYNYPDCSYIKKLDDKDPPTSIVYMGQISQHKGVITLLSAFDELAEKYAELSIKIAGAAPDVEGRMGSDCFEKIDSLKGKWGTRICFLGHVDDIGDLFAGGAIHVCPSQWDEPSPNAIFEAKLNSAPTIAFPRGGIPELIEHKIDGYLCESETAVSLAQGMRFFLDDQERYCSARRAARSSIGEKFSRQAFESKWLEVLENVIHGQN